MCGKRSTVRTLFDDMIEKEEGKPGPSPLQSTHKSGWGQKYIVEVERERMRGHDCSDGIIQVRGPR